MSDTCHCGHVLDEHGGNSKLRNDMSCTIEGCGCICFEANEEDDDEETE